MMIRWKRSWCATLLMAPLWLAALAPAATLEEWVAAFNADDQEQVKTTIPNRDAATFLRANAPTFECPDVELERTYYFRWWTYRKHLRLSPDGWVVTEFLPDVSWAQKHNTICCPAGHHFREGRWLRNRQILDDYARFYFGRGGSPRQYSFWAADSVLQFCNARGDHELAVSLLDRLIENYKGWEKDRLCSDGLFWQIDDRDGMEVSVGGTGKRATINSYQYGDALAIAAIARIAGREDVAASYEAKATALRQSINDRLWCEPHQFYKTLPYAPKGSKHQLGKRCGDKADGAWVHVRELHGYTPWYFNIPVQGAGREVAWKQLMDPQGFFAPFGPTTAEQRHPGFKVAYEGHECQWNGPSWPFATSVTLTAMANVLHDYPQDALSKADYLKMLTLYSASHRRKLEDGKVICWIDENLNPQTGDWISRTMLQKSQGKSKKPWIERGQDYNHSSFCDLVISGLMGLRVRADDEVVVDPLIPEGAWEWCRLENIPYHDRLITIQWDREGTKYGQGKGLKVFANGAVIASSERLEKVVGSIK